jgi:hypothetical protein
MLIALPPELLRLVLGQSSSRDAMALALTCTQTNEYLQPDIQRMKTAATRIQATVRRILVLLWFLGTKHAADSGFTTLQDVMVIPYWSAGITGRLRRYLFLHPHVKFKNILSWRSA